ncbi:MAG TPA: alpha-hydroxy acid oxidase [Phenylobacterium sp.]|uniref:alpha-hydroxy acid oxidase n=1 Tax=Phenylobacterium sp. TaxID=1871053 RepID=UPI002B492EB5|nr:alpha-hydroxy acid oxidase [Phenylobacterium sp.]HKR86691.1 alpha-hydroxy acid oxidase [Phenylobacterium sp.]
MPDPNRNTALAQLGGTPHRRYYTGRNLKRAVAIEDLRAMAHRRTPRFVLEYLEGGAEDEATLLRERTSYADWRFVPRQLVDVSERSLTAEILGKPASAPMIVAPTGLNGLFRPGGDIALAAAAAHAGVPFVQSTMSNDRMEDVACAPGLHHWWQLYVFGGDEIWQELLRRADAAGCEALVLTTNAQIFGNREWSARTQSSKTSPSIPTLAETLLHPPWCARALRYGVLPSFRNVVDFVPKGSRSFFECAFWIRDHQPTSLSWDTVAKIRAAWRKPFVLKGVLHPDDVRWALDAGVDAITLSSHGGRQLDWTVAGLDVLPAAREIVGDRAEIYVSGGVRRGTDMLKALALGADAVMAGRAPLYGLCAEGRAGVERALEILRDEALDAMGLLGASSISEIGRDLLAPAAPR